jgi:hypothetical protein
MRILSLLTTYEHSNTFDSAVGWGLRPQPTANHHKPNWRPIMAEVHSTRREAGLLAGKRGKSRTSRSHARPNAIRPNASRRARPSQSAEMVSEIEQMALVLRIAYSTCVVAELALQGQNADCDPDVLAALRHHVSEPVSRQAERLSALASKLRGWSAKHRDNHA